MVGIRHPISGIQISGQINIRYLLSCGASIWFPGFVDRVLNNFKFGAFVRMEENVSSTAMLL